MFYFLTCFSVAGEWSAFSQPTELSVWVHFSGVLLFPPLTLMFPIICFSLKPTYLRGSLRSLAGLCFHFLTPSLDVRRPSSHWRHLHVTNERTGHSFTERRQLCSDETFEVCGRLNPECVFTLMTPRQCWLPLQRGFRRYHSSHNRGRLPMTKQGCALNFSPGKI